MTQAYYHNPELRRIGSNLTRALLGDANTDRAVAGARYDTARAVGEETRNKNRQTLINNPELVGQWFAQQEGPGGIDYSQQPRDVLGALMGEYLQNPENLSLGRQRQLKTQPEVRKLGSEAGAADALRDERLANRDAARSLGLQRDATTNLVNNQLQSIQAIKSDPYAASLFLKAAGEKPEGKDGKYTEIQIKAIQNLAGWVGSSDNPQRMVQALTGVEDAQLKNLLTQEKINVQKSLVKKTEAETTTQSKKTLTEEERAELVRLQQKTEKNEALTEEEKAELVRLQQKDQKAQTEGRIAGDAAKVLTQEAKTLTENERAELVRLQQKTEKNEALTEGEKTELVRLQQKDQKAETEGRIAGDAEKLLTQQAKTLTEKAKTLTENEKAELVRLQQKTEKNEALTEGEKTELVRLQQKDQKAETEGRIAGDAAKLLTQEAKTLTENEKTELVRLQQKTEKNETLTEGEKAELVRLQQKDQKAETAGRIAEDAAKVLTQEAKTLTENERAELIRLQQKNKKQETLTEAEATKLKQLQQKTEVKKADKLSQEITSDQVKTFDDSTYKKAQINAIQKKLPFEIEALQALTKQRKANTKSGGYDQKDIKTFVDLWNQTSGAVPNFDLIPEGVRKKLGNAALRNWVPVIGTGADPVGAFDQAAGQMMEAPVPIGSTWGGMGGPEFYAPASIFNELSQDIKRTPDILSRQPGEDDSPSPYDIIIKDLTNNQGFTEDQAITLIEAASK